MFPCLASLLEDMALVGNQTHGAKDEEEQPHQTCLPPQSSRAPWAMGSAGVLGPEPEPLGLETTECKWGLFLLTLAQFW